MFIIEQAIFMETFKQKAIKAISSLPDNVDIDEIMRRLYVIKKIRKGEAAIERGESIKIEDLKREIQSW